MLGKEMTHLPFTLGHYMTAAGPVEIVHIGKGGKWAFDECDNRWLVATGQHEYDPRRNITGRIDPAQDSRPGECWIGVYSTGEFPSMAARSAAAVRDYNPLLRPVHMVEAADLARVKADLAEAVNILRYWDRLHISGTKAAGLTTIFLAKIGGK